MNDLLAALPIFTLSFGVAFSGALMPGPMLSVTISESLDKGSRVGPLTVLGHAVAELAVVVAVAVGLGPLLSPDPVVGTISVVGALVLLWMGITALRSSKSVAQQAVTSLNAESVATTFRRGGSLRCVSLGLLTSITNPYWILWWATPGLALLTQAMKINHVAIGLFFVGHILADLLWYWAVSIAVARGFRGISVKAYRTMLVICALFLVAMSVKFAISGSLKFLRPTPVQQKAVHAAMPSGRQI